MEGFGQSIPSCPGAKVRNRNQITYQDEFRWGVLYG